MKRLFTIAAAVALIGWLAGENASAQFIPYGANPSGNANKAAAQPNANNNAAQPNANNPAGRTQRPWSYSNPTYYHRPWSYGNPPYYNRPPTQYYPVPVPYYTNRPYYPYDAVDQGYGYYVAPWGGQPYYVPPRYYYQPYQTYPYYNRYR